MSLSGHFQRQIHRNQRLRCTSSKLVTKSNSARGPREAAAEAEAIVPAMAALGVSSASKVAGGIRARPAARPWKRGENEGASPGVPDTRPPFSEDGTRPPWRPTVTLLVPEARGPGGADDATWGPLRCRNSVALGVGKGASGSSSPGRSASMLFEDKRSAERLLCIFPSPTRLSTDRAQLRWPSLDGNAPMVTGCIRGDELREVSREGAWEAR